ncbi:MAG: DUF3054 domain-containing protein [Halanaeroarchaeum sp.]
MVVSGLIERLDLDRDALRRYLTGDLLLIGLFVAMGEVAHGSNPIAALSSWAQTTIAFALGWAIAAPVLGAYSKGTLEFKRLAIGLPVLSWAVADAIAQVLRSTDLFEGDAALSFYLVAFGTGGAFLAIWRYVAHGRGSS